MALQLSKTTPSGASATYHVVDQVVYSPISSTVSVHYCSFFDQPSFVAGMNCMDSFQYPSIVIGANPGEFPYAPGGADILTQIYTFLLTLPEWTEATAVA